MPATTTRSTKIAEADHTRIKTLAAREGVRDYQVMGAAVAALELLPEKKRKQLVAEQAARYQDQQARCA